MESKTLEKNNSYVPEFGLHDKPLFYSISTCENLLSKLAIRKIIYTTKQKIAELNLIFELGTITFNNSNISTRDDVRIIITSRLLFFS